MRTKEGLEEQGEGKENRGKSSGDSRKHLFTRYNKLQTCCYRIVTSGHGCPADFLRVFTVLFLRILGVKTRRQPACSGYTTRTSRGCSPAEGVRCRHAVGLERQRWGTGRSGKLSWVRRVMVGQQANVAILVSSCTTSH